MKEKIEVAARFVGERGEYGVVFEAICPDCGYRVRLTEDEGDEDCDCRDWSLNLIKATGINKN